MNTFAGQPTLVGIEVDFVADGRAGRIAAVRIAYADGIREATAAERASMEEGAIEALERAAPDWPCGPRRAGTLRLAFDDGSLDLLYAGDPMNDATNCKELTVAC